MNRRPTTITLALLTVVLGPDLPAATQGPAVSSAFTAEDMLKVTTVSVLDLSDDGRRVAVTERRTRDNAQVDHRRYGDPGYLAPSAVRVAVIDTHTGARSVIFPELVNVRGAAWSRDGRRLAVLVAVLAGNGDTSIARLHVWDADRAVSREVQVKTDKPLALNSGLAWSADGSHLIVALASPARLSAGIGTFRTLTEGPVIVHSSKDPFLEWDALNRASRWRSLVELDPATGTTREILAERRLTSYNVSRDGTFLTFMEDVTEKTDYETIGGTDSTLGLVQAAGGEPRTLIAAKDLKGLQLRWSDDGRTFAFARKGEVFVQRIDEKKPRSLTPPPEKDEGVKAADAAAGTTAVDGKAAERETFSVSLVDLHGSKLLATSKKGWYIVDTATAARTQVLTLDEDDEKNPRMSAVAWSPDGAHLFATWSARDRYERGLVRLDVASGSMTPLVRDSRLYGGFRLSQNGTRVVYTMAEDDRPADLYASSVDLTDPRRLTASNPWLATKSLPRSELVSYRDADGKLLHGVLRYPVGYEVGKRYPTVFEIYETFFDNGFNARAAFLANHGYAVFHPSVNLVVGRPGEAWVKGVTAAANRLVDLGVADNDRLGVHGTSYGGYATVLLITQTDRFKAAINISGKVDMVSFYTDSPRLGVRNTHAPEKSQDRIGGTMWEFPERYLEHSAVLRADRIKTPLLCITGDQDPNVPASQSREMYYALRRLGKEVEWVRYVNGGHRPPNSVQEAIDFEQRIVAWYDRYVKPGGKDREDVK
ncbi:MAG: prolyl oligopeptidase family serine peptidase [Acidobacteriota bacterium]